MGVFRPAVFNAPPLRLLYRYPLDLRVGLGRVLSFAGSLRASQRLRALCCVPYGGVLFFRIASKYKIGHIIAREKNAVNALKMTIHVKNPWKRRAKNLYKKILKRAIDTRKRECYNPYIRARGRLNRVRKRLEFSPPSLYFLLF